MNIGEKGELAELAFVLKAASLGFGVAKPHGTNERYDYVVDSGERFWRVQVKSTSVAFRGGYQVPSRGGDQKPYTAEEIDFLVAYIAPLGIWYVIPVNCVTSSTNLCLYPSGCTRGGHFERYREARHLMAARTSAASSEPK